MSILIIDDNYDQDILSWHDMCTYTLVLDCLLRNLKKLMPALDRIFHGLYFVDENCLVKIRSGHRSFS